jgi:hypothetical protein
MNDFLTLIMGLQQLGELRVSRGDSVNGSVFAVRRRERTPQEHDHRLPQ